jgi:hypothetical protein
MEIASKQTKATNKNQLQYFYAANPKIEKMLAQNERCCNQFLSIPMNILGNYSCLKVNLSFTRDRSFYFTTVFIPGKLCGTNVREEEARQA